MEAQQFGETHSEDELSKMEKGYIHASTDKNSQWAARTLSQWLKQQNANATDNEKCLEGLPLSQYPAKEPCKWSCCFVSKKRKEDGKAQSPQSCTYCKFHALLMFMSEIKSRDQQLF